MKRASIVIEPRMEIGRITVIRRVGPSGRDIAWEVHCAGCGNNSVMRAGNLRDYYKKNENVSCGCLNQYRHGYGRNPRYKVYRAMLDRCYNPDSENYHRYGGRGIKVCDRWRNDINAFMADTEKGYQRGLQIDRINNNGNYEPSNVRWATAKENNNNRECVKEAFLRSIL